MSFIPSDTFVGPREGFHFTRGPQGQGYYSNLVSKAGVDEVKAAVSEAAAKAKPSSNALALLFEVGDRVGDSVSSDRGTVRYVGPVATSKSAKTIWVGVEWDDKTRGKHDGSVSLGTQAVRHRYFRCTPGAGSFCKAAKLRRGGPYAAAVMDAWQPPNDAQHSMLRNLEVRVAGGGEVWVGWRGW